jgi:hypothetical protein
MDISYTTLQLFMKQKNNSAIKQNYLNLLQQLTNAENIKDNVFNKTIDVIHKNNVIYIVYLFLLRFFFNLFYFFFK